jgi:uncharacterized protein
MGRQGIGQRGTTGFPERKHKMAAMIKVEHQDMFMGKLGYGADLLSELTGICIEKNIRLGSMEAIGAVQKAALGFYNQTTREYEFLTINEHLEITNLKGNISTKDGAPFVHAHITLADSAGRAYGGHLVPGTIVFACEFILQTFSGPALARDMDNDTGLFLWKLPPR